jgi:hypothetical protein
MKTNLISKSAIVAAAAVSLGLASLPTDASAWVRHGFGWRGPIVWNPGWHAVHVGTLGCVRHVPGGWVNVCLK